MAIFPSKVVFAGQNWPINYFELTVPENLVTKKEFLLWFSFVREEQKKKRAKPFLLICGNEIQFIGEWLRQFDEKETTQELGSSERIRSPSNDGHLGE